MRKYLSLLLLLGSVLAALDFFGVWGKVLSLVDLRGETTIILAGDVMLGRSVMTKSLSLSDPVYPFRKVAEVLKEADLVFVNLENPIVAKCPKDDLGLKFCADPAMVGGLVFSGVDIVTVANNHSLNFGEAGLFETKSFLDEAGILHTGSGNLVVRSQNATKFGFLGFNFVGAKLTDEELELVRKSDSETDVLIVGVHWGSEYTGVPSDSQKEWARQLVGAGADVIVGHHPHWVQPVEYIDSPTSPFGLRGASKPVYYSLGNFVFDQMWSQKTREGLVVKLTFRGSEIVKEERLPVFMSSWAQPEFISQ